MTGLPPSRHHPNQRRLDSLPAELRRSPVSRAARAWVAAEAGASVTKATRLPGASTSAVHRLHLADGLSVVLRRYAWRGFLELEPVAPRREVDALLFARARGLPVPEVIAFDLAGEAVGDGVPAVLTAFLPGRAVSAPDLDELAKLAARIHDVDPAGFGHDYFPWYAQATTGPPAEATRPELWDSAIAIWQSHRPAFRPSFIHRDFHPGNVLWSRGRSTGVVDWVDACRGPWGCDVATCRAELMRLAGPEAADRFLSTYLSLTGRTLDPYWEIASVLEHGPSGYDPETIARSERRLERALG